MTKLSKSVFVREATGLTRELSASDVLMYNLLDMGLAWPLVYMFFASSGYPGANLPITVLVGFFPNLIIALLFYYLSVAMPRTGGDYVWCSRLVHPAIGFMESFAVVAFWLSYSGPVDGFLVPYGIGSMFTNLAVATGNPGYLNLATMFSGQMPLLIGSLVVVATVILVAGFGLRNAFKFQWATFILTVIGVAIFLIVLGTSSPEMFKSNFNQLSGANYDGLIQAAHSAGLTTDFTLGGTVIGSLFSFTLYLGYQTSAYLGGEVRQAHRSQLIGIVWSTVIFALIVFLVWEAPYLIMGGSFISAVSQLSAAGNSAYTLPMPPVLSYLIMFANPNPIVGVLVPLAIIATLFGSQETIVLMCVRIIFSWSFDGVTPAKLADISEKRASPNNALAVVAVVMTIYVLLSVFAANVLTFFSYTTSGVYLALAFVGVAGILLPYKHKDMFLASPPSVQRKIAGVPLIAILGVLTLLTGIFVAFIAASPIFTGAPVNPYYIIAMAVIFIVGLLAYEGSLHYQKSKGIDLSVRFKQIPPE